jgi:predicted porin
MNRTLLVAALAALGATSALAQSTVTIYGRLNVSAEARNSNDVKTSVLGNNASRIGFKGTEDLGGGLQAGFVLEHGFDPSNGLPGAEPGAAGSAFWGRQSEVNLSGGFGTVRLGNFTSEAYYATSDYIGMHNHETGTSSDALYAYIGRNTNKVAYRTPSLGGATIEAAVSAGEGGGRARNYDVAVNYGAGPLHVGVGYEKAGGNAKQLAVSGLYEMGSLVFGAMVQRDTDGLGAGLGNRTNFRGSVAYIFGASELHLNVGRAGEYSKLKNSDATQYTLGYNYNLSKRTKVYTYYTAIDDSKIGLYTGGARANGKDGEFSSLALGVRHNF